MRTTIFLLLVGCLMFIGCGSDSPSGTVSAATPTVFKKSFVGQLGAIPVTTITTAPADGDYLMSIYISSPATGIATQQGGGSVSPIWADENGPVDNTLENVIFGAGGVNPQHAQKTFSLHVKGGTNIQVSGQFSAISGPPAAYDVFITLQILQ